MRKNIFKYIPLYFIQYRRRKSKIEININGIHNVSRRIFDNEDDYLIFIWYKCNRWFFSISFCCNEFDNIII